MTSFIPYFVTTTKASINSNSSFALLMSDLPMTLNAVASPFAARATPFPALTNRCPFYFSYNFN